MPLIPVPGPLQIANFAAKIRQERKRKATAPQLTLDFAREDEWLTGNALNIRASVRVTNCGQRAASLVAIMVPSLVWSPGGTNPQRDDTGGWRLGLKGQFNHLDWMPQELTPAENRFAAVAQIRRDELIFIGGANTTKTFEETGILAVRAVLSWADGTAPVEAYTDEYEIEICWRRRSAQRPSTFRITVGLVPV
jgi:hypothetical protein